MSKFMLFGLIPVQFNPDGSWQASTGGAVTDWFANGLSRAILIGIDQMEVHFGIEIPVRLDPVEGFHA